MKFEPQREGSESGTSKLPGETVLRAVRPVSTSLWGRLRDTSEYPRFNLFLEMLFDTLLIAGAVSLVVGLYAFLSWIYGVFSVGERPESLEPYVPIDVIRILVTVFSVVSVLLAVIVGFFTVIRWAREVSAGSKRSVSSESERSDD